MRSTSCLSTTDVILDLDASSKRSLLDTISREAAHRLGRPQAEILGALQARETLGSTALGRGIALPHARLVGDDPPLMLFARLRHPVDYEARDEEPVDIVILSALARGLAGRLLTCSGRDLPGGAGAAGAATAARGDLGRGGRGAAGPLRPAGRP